jgi:carboxyl-terminal processing protease
VLGDTRRDDDAWEFMLDKDKNIGYIRITAFSRDTTKELKKALTELSGRKLKGLILDLRFNPGGLLQSAIDISDLFVADGKIVSTEGRNAKPRIWKAEKAGTFEGFPMVVLVNRYSASASEIVAACLQDHSRAIVIGERSWGKGSVQNVIELEQGKSALKLTTASYQRPNGHNIHRFPDSKESDEWGVKPNDGYEIKLSDGELQRLNSHRRARDILVARVKATKPEEKPEEKKPEEKKLEEKKPDEKKPDEAKPDDKKDGAKKEGDKPNEASKTDDPKDGDKKDGDKKDGDKKDDKTPPDAAKPATDAAAKPDPAEAAKKPEFVDRQLQKAIEYLTSELDRAK